MSERDIQALWLDQGGTFSDFLTVSATGDIVAKKLLSSTMVNAADPLAAIFSDPAHSSDTQVKQVKLGTTLATNTLLEKNGTQFALIVNNGFEDLLRIGDQRRPQLFSYQIPPREQLAKFVCSIDGRINTDGQIICSIDEQQITTLLKKLQQQGIQHLAVSFINSWANPEHELTVQKIAKTLGFSSCTLSHQVSASIHYLNRTSTTVIETYLYPQLFSYLNKVGTSFDSDADIKCMQSAGGLVAKRQLKAKDSILSGPAGGVIASTKFCKSLGIDSAISFDMGGTSTDVCCIDGEIDRRLENEIYGLPLISDMLDINTVAAGGGSILGISADRITVGPKSAGSYPGPCCYGNDGPVTVTDCNLLLGRIDSEYLPKLFGKNANLGLDLECTKQKFEKLLVDVNESCKANYTDIYELANAFLQVANLKMSKAIRTVSIEKGHSLENFTLCSYGGASGQHCCSIATELGIKQILIHPLAGLFSSFGIGCADQITTKVATVNLSYEKRSYEKRSDHQQQTKQQQKLEAIVSDLHKQLKDQIHTSSEQKLEFKVHLLVKPERASTNLKLPYLGWSQIQEQYLQLYQKQFGYIPNTDNLLIETVIATLVAQNNTIDTNLKITPQQIPNLQHNSQKAVYIDSKFINATILDWALLKEGDKLQGPLVIVDTHTSVFVEPNWNVTLVKDRSLKLSHDREKYVIPQTTDVSPASLEIFHNKLMMIAEQMGTVLQKAAMSINIKERFDYSCAIFDKNGNLVANAPHIPVHLGSMSECVKSLINFQQEQQDSTLAQSYLSNSPYVGGTHLPDLTVVTPVIDNESNPIFYVASRGHHADIGGITPGSIPAFSTHIDQEGIRFEHFPLVKAGMLQTQPLLEHLTQHQYPARNPQMNIADLQAQLSANKLGESLLLQYLVDNGAEYLSKHISALFTSASASVQAALQKVHPGSATLESDNGFSISVAIVHQPNKKVLFDFSKSSKQNQNSNFNAPLAVTKSVVLYFLRSLVASEIPLNAGCLEKIDLCVPKGSILNPSYPCPVVAGNIETSQLVADALYQASGILANSQGTMNNITFGNEQFQFYETICGGSGASKTAPGADAVHSHMTNSKITDPELIEQRFPLRVIEFAIRKNSAGLGKQHGGQGVIRKIQVLTPCIFSIISSRRTHKALGICGGGAGAPGNNYLLKPKHKKLFIDYREQLALDKYDIAVIETPGGGAYGTS